MHQLWVNIVKWHDGTDWHAWYTPHLQSLQTGESNPKQAGGDFRGQFCDPKVGVPKFQFGVFFCMRAGRVMQEKNSSAASRIQSVPSASQSSTLTLRRKTLLLNSRMRYLKSLRLSYLSMCSLSQTQVPPSEDGEPPPLPVLGVSVYFLTQLGKNYMFAASYLS